ncbi:3-dehydroquinate synthase [Candidatus Peregrinibacteria bacterium]|nr:3-dehydroquinate synthase [Candidatus Peregrinibacteria bacterium]
MKKPKIIIDTGAFKTIPHKIKDCGGVFTIITDNNLKNLGEELLKNMRAAGLKCFMLILPAGEGTKSLAFIERAAKSLLKFKIRRSDCLVALGGGMIGDFTGFLASIYMRGISYVSVPTTLLAMGDSAIGGKTGVDMEEGKNLLGAFYNPRTVIMDPLLLKKMTERSFRFGLAEIVKHAVIKDAVFFKMLEKNVNAILQRKPAVLKKIIGRSVQIKLKIVGRDPHESLNPKRDSRMLLNYGHTVGHALEKLSNYSLPHGEAVSVGMAAENRLAVGKNLLKETDANRIETLLKRFHLPTKIPSEFSDQDLKRAMDMDKKNIGGKLCFALPICIGKAKVIQL